MGAGTGATQIFLAGAQSELNRSVLAALFAEPATRPKLIQGWSGLTIATKFSNLSAIDTTNFPLGLLVTVDTPLTGNLSGNIRFANTKPGKFFAPIAIAAGLVVTAGLLPGTADLCVY
jgi:hypothetical protein